MARQENQQHQQPDHTIPAKMGEQLGLAQTILGGALLGRDAVEKAESEVEANWSIGDVFMDLYQVIGLLGEGGMGKVYKVRHRGWNVDLAVKSPKLEIFSKEVGKYSFVREAETWVRLGLHPHIVSCYYVRTLGGIPRLFAEYIEAGSLSDWLRNRKLYDGGEKKALERILDVAIQFAWGLQ